MDVCVVDKDPSTYESLIDAFANLSRFEDAESLLARWNSSIADSIVVANVHLPGISGMQLIHELRKRGFATPVILVCRDADVATAVQAIRSGAADFIEIPFSRAHLAHSIRCSHASRR